LESIFVEPPQGQFDDADESLKEAADEEDNDEEGPARKK
jgi:hypothetical protein